jgi:NAD(P)-dependent dehydrogenase (short-subunit alcohol dehydrogenase family)
VERIVQISGRIDASIHVAGNPGGRWGDEITTEEFDAMIAVHLRGMMFCCKHAARAMVSTGGGAIVNFSSAASINYDPLISYAYSSAKAGINSLTKSFAGRYGAQGIRVNAIAPGFTLSEKNQAAPDDIMASLSSRAALGRAGQPEEQASVAVFLASDLSSFVSGVTIPVDGGWTARLA